MANNLSYTGRDTVDIRQELNNLIPSLTDKWRDLSESDLGEVIVGLIAGAQDYQNFYLDNQVFETYLDTAQQDRNIRSLLRAMNYRIPFIGSAKGEVTVTFNEPVPEGIDGGYFVIPKYTKLSNHLDNKVSYLTRDTVQAVSGSTEVSVEVIEGTLRTMTVTRKTLESNITLSGGISRRVYLRGGDSTKYADKSVEITQGNGIIWKEVEDAILEYDGGTLYSVHQDSHGQTYILMSVNFMNYMPSNPDEEVSITWIQSLGTSGVVNKGVLDTFIGFRDWKGRTLEVTNPIKTYGAYDTPNLSELKPIARRKTQTLGRYITIDDYKNGVEEEPYIFKSVVKDWKSRQYVEAPYIVKIWAVDSSNQDLGAQDVKALKTKLMSKGVTDIDVQYIPTSFVKIRIDIDLILAVSSASSRLDLEKLVGNYISERYSLGNLSYAYQMSTFNLMVGIKGLSSYIRGADVKFYTGATTTISSYNGYDISVMSQSLRDIENSKGITSADYQSALVAYLNTIVNDLKSDTTEVERFDIEDITYLSDLKVVTWGTPGDVALDDIEFPVIYQVNVKSHLDGDSYDL